MIGYMDYDSDLRDEISEAEGRDELRDWHHPADDCVECGEPIERPRDGWKDHHGYHHHTCLPMCNFCGESAEGSVLDESGYRYCSRQSCIAERGFDYWQCVGCGRTSTGEHVCLSCLKSKPLHSEK